MVLTLLITHPRSKQRCDCSQMMMRLKWAWFCCWSWCCCWVAHGRVLLCLLFPLQRCWRGRPPCCWAWASGTPMTWWSRSRRWAIWTRHKVRELSSPSVCLSVCLSVCVPVCLSLCLSLPVSVFPSLAFCLCVLVFPFVLFSFSYTPTLPCCLSKAFFFGLSVSFLWRTHRTHILCKHSHSHTHTCTHTCLGSPLKLSPVHFYNHSVWKCLLEH